MSRRVAGHNHQGFAETDGNRMEAAHASLEGPQDPTKMLHTASACNLEVVMPKTPPSVKAASHPTEPVQSDGPDGRVLHSNTSVGLSFKTWYEFDCCANECARHFSYNSSACKRQYSIDTYFKRKLMVVMNTCTRRQYLKS
jgi:hypothetical protein